MQKKTKIKFKDYCPTCKWLALKGQIMEINNVKGVTGPCLECIRFSDAQGTSRPLNYIYWSENDYGPQ